MKVALADKPAVPFRVPPGIKLIRIDPKTGMRAGPGTERAILEAFKPGTAPPDSYSVIGVGDGEGGGGPPAVPGAGRLARRRPRGALGHRRAVLTRLDARLRRRGWRRYIPHTDIDTPLRRHWNMIMRAETQNLVEEIKQSVGLLRRHL